MAACPACGKENPEEARFCLACGSSLDAEPSPREVRKTVTILRCDVTGSTSLGEQLDPESLRRVMSRLFDEMGAVIESHGGTVEKFIGDAVMAVFGVPQAHEDDALRAVRAAAEMRDRMKTLNDELERDRGVRLALRTGVTTGEVVAGDPSTRQTFVTGDPANVAARLEQSAEPDEVLLGEQTYALVRSAVEAAPLPPLQVKGKAQPLQTWRLLRVLPGAEQIPRRFDTPMVGREHDLEELAKAFAAAKVERSCRLVTIVGEPGIGKSRLAAEFSASVSNQATVLRGRCLPYGAGITYWPLVEIVRSAAQGETRAHILELLVGEPDAELVADRVAAAVGARRATSTTEETFWATRKLVERLARDRPLVLIVDDLQWAEPTFFDLLEHLTYLVRSTPILLLCLARPELAEVRPRWPEPRLRLEPLSSSQSRTLVDQLAGRIVLDEGLQERIAKAAEGNPLFVEQMLAMVDGPVDELAVPATIQALLAARLDRLGAEERAVLDCAAVVGEEFWSGAVGALTRSDPSRTLLELVRVELIRPRESLLRGEDAYEFVHLLIRDAAYGSTPKETRAALHERLADWLHAKDEEQGVSHDEIVGYHLEQAHRYRTDLGPRDEEAIELAGRAGEHLGSAGHSAYLHGDTPAALSLLSRAAELLPAGEPRRFEILADLSTALLEVGDREHAADAISQLSESADPATAALGRVQHRLLKMQAGIDIPFVEEAALDAEAAIELLERANDHRGLARAWLLLGEVANTRDRRDEMGEGARRSAEHAHLAGDTRAEAEGIRLWGGALVYGPIPAPEGIAQLELVLARGDVNLMVEAAVVAPLAALKAMRGDFEAARRGIDRARQIQLELGLRLQLARLGFMSSRVERLAGNLEAAESELRQSLEALIEVGERGRSFMVALELAGVLSDLGRPQEALQALEYARVSPRIEEDHYWLLYEGKVLSALGDTSGGEHAASRAVELGAQSDDLAAMGDALLSLAAIRADTAGAAAARPLLDQAVEVFERKGDLVSAEKARALAGELTAEQPAERD
jgi:class 3 adenylate cyclase/tetratricopeptide (TPR) repeat protein